MVTRLAHWWLTGAGVCQHIQLEKKNRAQACVNIRIQLEKKNAKEKDTKEKNAKEKDKKAGLTWRSELALRAFREARHTVYPTR